jgi:hypothetical protein
MRYQALAGSSPVTDPGNGFSNLSSIVVASTASTATSCALCVFQVKRLRRMQEELHVICGFPVQIRVVPSRVR